MTKEVRLKQYIFKSYLESKFNKKCHCLNGNDYFEKAFEMWFTMITDGKSDRVTAMICTDEYDVNNNHVSGEAKNPLVELAKSVVGKSEHTLPTIALAFLEKLPINASKEETDSYLRLIEETRERFDKLLGKNGLLIFPSFPSTAPFHNQALFTNPLDWAVYFGIINTIGLPSTNVPLGLNFSDGLPVGIQLIANRFCDKLPIKLAQYLESQNDLVNWIQPGLPSS